MFKSAAKPLSGRYLSLAEREDILLLLVQGHSLQEIGRRLGRCASTISREVRRNATTRGGALDYRATVAQWHAERSARRPKKTKLAGNAALRSYVEERLAGVVRTGYGHPVPRTSGVVEGAPARPAAGSAMGVGLEPGTDRQASGRGLPG